jgi:Ca2+:H+ antiporter
MQSLFKEIRRNPLLWLLAVVPIVLVSERAMPEAHTVLFVLAVLAIVPLAALLSHATEAVAVKTGDAVGGLLNATLGNLTELIIAVTALHAGQYLLVKASIAGAIVTNALFMLGASFLLGGLRYHVQEYNRAGGRLYSALLLMATVALLAPSAVADLVHGEVLTQKLSVGLAVLLIIAYGLGLVFSLHTHKEIFCERGAWRGRGALADRPSGRNASRRHCAGRACERDLCGIRAEGSGNIWDEPGLRRLHHRLARRRRG